VRLYHQIGQFDSARPFEPYLLRSVVNAALNSTRRVKQQISLDGSGTSGATLVAGGFGRIGSGFPPA
jgi:DNA-directed RNA polymerase specialized sigma24 family protein